MDSRQQSSQGIAEAADFEQYSLSDDSRFDQGRQNNPRREAAIHAGTISSPAQQQLYLLGRQLQQSKRKIIEILRQKENLAGSYESQSAYISELTGRIGELERQKAQWQDNISRLTDRQAAADETLLQLNNELQAARSETQRLTGRIEELERQKIQAQDQICRLTDGQTTAQNETLDRLDGQLQAARSQIEQLAGQRDAMAARVVVLEDMEGKYRNSFDEIKSLRDNIASLQSELEAGYGKLEDTNNQLRRTVEIKDKLEEQLNRQNAHTEQLSRKESALAQHLQEQNLTVEQARQANRQLLEEMEQKTAGYEKQLDDYKRQNQSLQSNLQDKTAENESLGKQAVILKGYESQYHTARQENRTLQSAIEAIQARLGVADKELADVNVGWQQSRNEKQALEEQLNRQGFALTAFEQSRDDIQRRLSAVTEEKELAQDQCRRIQAEFDQSRTQLCDRLSERDKEVLSLQLCIQNAIKQQETLTAEIERLKDIEIKYQESLTARQTLCAETARMQEEMVSGRAELEQARYEWKESQQRQGLLEQEVNAGKENIRQLGQQYDMLRRQLDAKDQAIEQAQGANRQLQLKLERRQEQFDKDLATREQEIQSLWSRFGETSDIVRQFEEQFRRIKAENARLREDAGQISGQLTTAQGRITQQNMENAGLQKQISQLQHSLTLSCSDTDGSGESAMRIRALEEGITERAAELEAARAEMQKHKALAEQLQEKLSQSGQSRQPQAVQAGGTGDDIDAEFLKKEQFLGHDVTADPMKRKLYEAMSRIQTLRLQLQDRTENLKKAHQTIQLLRDSNR